MSFWRRFWGNKDGKVSGGLYESAPGFFGKLGQFFERTQPLSAQEFEQLEELFISADMGVETSFFLLDQIKNVPADEALSVLKNTIRSTFAAGTPADQGDFLTDIRPYVILVIGVNGAGKTTTIAKLAQRYHAAGHSVLLGAADTFREAAIEQLCTWANRVGVEVVKRERGADPSAVIHDAVGEGIARQKDVVILDTAGRLHNKKQLMDELGKIRRTVEKKLSHPPAETLLVIDGSTGQNAINQVEEFSKSAPISGLVVTKLDAGVKAGFLLNLTRTFRIPTRYIGVGEGVSSLETFNPEDYISALFAGR